MVQKFSKIADCIALAEFAHRNQTDKAGEPYINHPRRVLESVRAIGAPVYAQMAAILHDVTEDTAFTPEMLIELGVPEAAVNIVRLLDRDISLEEFMIMDPLRPVNKGFADEYYYKQIKANHWAAVVKKADIGDNLQPWRLEYLSEEKQAYLQDKYAKALRLLK